MKQFEISINNRPGEIAKVADIISSNGINIVAIASERCDAPIVRIVTDDEQSTRTALTKANMKFKENELLVLHLTDKPGELTKVTKKLAKSGVNIESIHLLSSGKGTTNVALVVDKNDKAKDILH